jgi:hypothetical protein
MTRTNDIPGAGWRALALIAAATVLSGCAVLRPGPLRGARPSGAASAACAPVIARAHTALGTVGGSPAETAGAHAAHAAAMAEYHACLADAATR